MIARKRARVRRLILLGAVDSLDMAKSPQSSNLLRKIIYNLLYWQLIFSLTVSKIGLYCANFFAHLICQ